MKYPHHCQHCQHQTPAPEPATVLLPEAPESRLERFAAMRDKGIVTEAEFQAVKTKSARGHLTSLLAKGLYTCLSRDDSMNTTLVQIKEEKIPNLVKLAKEARHKSQF